MRSLQTLYDKLWNDHVVHENDDGSVLLYIDAHLIHEVTSPQAFEGLRLSNRQLWRKNSMLAVPDHSVPTTDRSHSIKDKTSRIQLETLEKNCHSHAISYIPLHSNNQGIVHIIGPEQGFTMPGITLVCGDSHTSTHGALACLAMGIGTSDVEHVMATQCLIFRKLKNMRVCIKGKVPEGVAAKDIILHIIGSIGTASGSGYAIEYTGDTIENLSMEGRMTICNMTIEAGSRSGLIACDDTTMEYMSERPLAPRGKMWEAARRNWKELKSDIDSHFDKTHTFSVEDIEPQVTWGTSPEMVTSVTSRVPNPENEENLVKSESRKRALAYMGLTSGTEMRDINLDRIFIGSCTNSRIEDLRVAAKVARNYHVAKNIKQALVVPGSGKVRQQAEKEGLDKIFMEAGFDWRLPGCSMCIAMNSDRVQPGERCASTSNRNFEGRQGGGGRTHLASPAMVAAAAINGRFVDIREWDYR